MAPPMLRPSRAMSPGASVAADRGSDGRRTLADDRETTAVRVRPPADPLRALRQAGFGGDLDASPVPAPAVGPRLAG
jgi:hypothetical protein